METFGERLRRLRTEAGISQSRLAALVSISPETLSRYESGKQQVADPAVAARLDELLNADGGLAAFRSRTAAEIVLTLDDRAHPPICRVPLTDRQTGSPRPRRRARCSAPAR